MESIIANFRRAQIERNGPLLSTTISPIPPESDPKALFHFYHSSNSASVDADIRYAVLYDQSPGLHITKIERQGWVDVYVAYWKAVGEILAAEKSGSNAEWSKVYGAWKDVSNAIIRGYLSHKFQAWTVPCLYVAGKYLRVFAIKADEQAGKKGAINFTAGFQDDIAGDFGKNEKLEDAARVINRIFTSCISDRAPVEDSRKWGLYYTANLLFKTYFKLNSIGLSKNILRAIEASKSDMPELEYFPAAHIVTFKYYVGVIHFLEEDYAKAEESLTQAWKLCHKDARKNKELILTYLIPCHLLTTHTLPTQHLLSPYPRLQALFGPLSRCIKHGDLAGFDTALAAGEDEFVKRRIYLTLERGRDIALRNLLRKVFLAGGFDPPKEGEAPVRRTRVPVAEFVAAVRLGSKIPNEKIDTDEVECLVANLIYKNLMKGYIARERSIVVLSKGGTAFPGTGV
ncbi:MAG: COP9 signalosome (CSN) subunit [Sarea resinae]|nr:MAG: COP9 signalosome (CSN) subunit [Sarea resinae]